MHETANKILEHLNARRTESWILTVENVDMKHSSRKACAISLTNILAAKIHHPTRIRLALTQLLRVF